MKTRYNVLILLMLSAALFAHAEPLQLQKSVSVERDLVTRDGHYLLLVRTGTWRIDGVLFNRANNHAIEFVGTQKGYALTLQSQPNTSTQLNWLFTGTLNLSQNRIDGVLTDADNRQTAFTFEPYIPVSHRPQFQFQFFGDDNARVINQIHVLQNGKHIQTLDGFSAHSDQAIYADYNFDGYFDLHLNINNEQSLFWLYQPQTGQFVRDEFLNKMHGVVSRYPHKMTLRFGDTLLERRGNTWRKLPCCAALN